jgi:hypothetical protein
MQDESMQSLGGKARADKLTAAERKAIAKRASDARWNLEQATHSGTLTIGNMSFPCSVLSDGTRILTQSDFMAGMGMYYSGWVAKNQPEDRSADLPHFMGFKTLKPYIDRHLGDMQSIVVKYRTERGAVAHGIKAEIIPKICEVWMDADEEMPKLGVRQRMIAKKARIIMRALAHVGILALVDEATGYQADRAKDALAKILEQFIAKELRPWARTFPLEFYKQIFRLRGWPFDPKKVKRPSVIGTWTNNIVYARLAPGVLEELKAKSPKIDGRRKNKLFQWLTGDIGNPKLLAHFEGLKIIMRDSTDWDDFKKRLNHHYPIITQTELGFTVETLD